MLIKVIAIDLFGIENLRELIETDRWARVLTLLEAYAGFVQPKGARHWEIRCCRRPRQSGAEVLEDHVMNDGDALGDQEHPGKASHPRFMSPWTQDLCRLSAVGPQIGYPIPLRFLASARVENLESVENQGVIENLG